VRAECERPQFLVLQAADRSDADVQDLPSLFWLSTLDPQPSTLSLPSVVVGDRPNGSRLTVRRLTRYLAAILSPQAPPTRRIASLAEGLFSP
jgi:hypothetical protein